MSKIINIFGKNSAKHKPVSESRNGAALEMSESKDWLSLDDYVKGNGNANNILYARVRGVSMVDAGISDGDLIVTDRDKKPTASDIVLIEVGTAYTIKYFSEVQDTIQPLRLAARNGETVKSKKQVKNNVEPLKIIGVVTHVLKTLGGVR